MKRILILHGGGGLGHKKAAEALEEALKKNFPSVEVKNVNVLDFGSRAFEKIFNDGYDFISTKVPELWRHIYRHFQNAEEDRLPMLLSRLSLGKKFADFIRTYNPDFIISTHPFPIQVLSYAKEHDILKIPSANVITDFVCHRLWTNKDVNLYFVAHEETKKQLMKIGIEEQKITVSGIPVSTRFQKEFDKNALKKKFGFEHNEKIFLMVGGRLTLRDIELLAKDFEVQSNVGVMIVAGRDTELEEKLKVSKLTGHVKVFGFLENIDDAFGAADLILSKSGGLTVSECLCMGLPMVLHKVIPGQEEGNMEFLLRHNLGIRAQKRKDVAPLVREFFSNEKKLQELHESCKNYGKPFAADTVARDVMEYLGIREKE